MRPATATPLFLPDTGPVLGLDFQDTSHGTLVAGHPRLGSSVVDRDRRREDLGEAPALIRQQSGRARHVEVTSAPRARP